MPHNPSHRPTDRLLIGIAGGSASGKTTLARSIFSLSPNDVTLIELDRFYHPLTQGVDADSKNYDHPSALDFELLRSVCDDIQNQSSTKLPIYDFTKHDRVGMEEITPKSMVIIEGILAFWDRGIQALFQQKLFVDTPAKIRFERRLRRDCEERGRDIQSVTKQWRETVEPMHDQYVRATQHHADQTIDGTSDLNLVATNLIRVWNSRGKKQ